MSENSTPFLTIIVPVFNSHKSISRLCEVVYTELSKFQHPFELILVDDGSQDESWQQISGLKKEYPFIKGIRLTKNCGQHKALMCGVKSAKGEWIVTLDDDLQFSPADIALLLEKATTTGARLVYGLPQKKEQSVYRRLGSSFITYVFTHFADMKMEGSSFKIFHRDLAEVLTTHSHLFLFIDEVLQWHATDIATVAVSHRERAEGKSTYTLWKLIRLGLKYIVGYTTFPLRIISFFGLLSFLICLGFIVYFLYMKYNFGAELGFTAIIVSIFMSTGLILFSLGVIGEYLNRLFHLQSSKPLYVIKEQI